MGGVEVAVCEVVAHAGDLAPGDVGLGCEPVLGKGFDCLANLDQSDPDGVEDQAVGQISGSTWDRIASIAAMMSTRRCWSR